MKNINFILLILVIRKKYWRGEKRFHLTMSSIQHRRLIYLTGELFFPFFYVILLISIHVEHNYFHALGLFQVFLPLTSLLDFVKKKFSSSNLEIFDFNVWTQESGESLSLSLCLIQSGQQNDVLLRRISLFYFWWLMSNHAEQSKNQAIIFSHSVVLEIIP